MVAGKKTASEYVGEWRRASLPIPPTVAIDAAAEAEAQRLDEPVPARATAALRRQRRLGSRRSGARP
jgi:hypothetical protein